MKLKFNNNKGSVFITVTVILSILLIMLGLMLTVTSTDVRISQSYADGVTAYYLAESGAALAMAYAVENPKQRADYSEILTKADSDFSYSKDYTIEWKVIYDKDSDDYTITSESTYGKARRKIQVLISMGKDDKITINEWRLE